MGNQNTGTPVYEKVWTGSIVKPPRESSSIFSGTEFINNEKIPFYTNIELFKILGDNILQYMDIEIIGFGLAFVDSNFPTRFYVNEEYKTRILGVEYVFFYDLDKILTITAIDTMILKADNTYQRNPRFLQQNTLISVPIINIESQTFIGGSDIGNTIFKIYDEILYYDKIPESLNKCKNYEIIQNNMKATLFDLCQVDVSPVVIGTAKNLLYKTSDIYNSLGKDKIGVDFKDFRLNMLLYALLKYILARLIYGNFNTKYLLNKYYKKFLNDLQDSRFCEAYDLFMDKNSKFYGYEIYFK